MGMLVVISDLHLNDGSAAPENIKSEAFAIWMTEVVALARQNEAKELIFLYLGDMVDLLRTEYWFYPKSGAQLAAREYETFALADRPWGSADVLTEPNLISTQCRARAVEILAKIEQHADEQLKYLRGDIDDVRADLSALGIPIQRIYVPGNHDRLFWVDPQVQQGILRMLGAKVVPGPRPFEIALPEYGLIARHGHEWDPWNYEAYDPEHSTLGLRVADYAQTPIGDPITTELLARLPYEVGRSLPPEIPDDVRAQVCAQLRHVEDVRPLSEALRWVLVAPSSLALNYDSATRETIINVVNDVAKQVIAEFMQIPFVKAWLAKHDRWNLGLDEADMLQDVYRASKILDIGQFDAIIKWCDKLGLMAANDDSLPALRETGDVPLAQFCVYGHTHQFRHVPLGRNHRGAELVFLNTGTWRPRVLLAKDRKSFVTYKEMSYIAFYRQDEDRASPRHASLSYEFWTGAMKK
jgi:UDP-2,3-diacylglucosamine pyrophosphatase LpxH